MARPTRSMSRSGRGQRAGGMAYLLAGFEAEEERVADPSSRREGAAAAAGGATHCVAEAKDSSDPPLCSK